MGIEKYFEKMIGTGLLAGLFAVGQGENLLPMIEYGG